MQQQVKLMDQENLGPMEPWQIRAFPSALRARLTDEAHAARTTVGDLLTAIVLRHYDAGAPSIGSNNAIDVAPGLVALIPHMPNWLRAAYFRQLAARLGIEPPRRTPAPRRLTATVDNDRG